jgi:serine protease Do
LLIKVPILPDRSIESINAFAQIGQSCAMVIPKVWRARRRGQSSRRPPNTGDKQLMTDRPSRFVPSDRRHSPLACLALGCCLLLSFYTAYSTASELRQSPIVKAVQRVRPAVVNIRGEKTVAAPVGQASTSEANRRVNGMGTGVLIDGRGYIITNFHVIDGVREIQVTQASGKRQTAKLVARDTETDLALIKIDPDDTLPIIPIGTSSDLMTGETVIAVGNAYGYEHTVTRGIVSALHRSVQVTDAQFYDDLIQTDASINPGNSGGPLLNIDGDVIGINVAVRAGAQGIGFAIPIDKVVAVAVGLLANCNADKTWIGMESSRSISLERRGMAIGAVEPKGPAAEAGLVAGDVITCVDDLTIERPLDFQRAMLDHKPGDTLRLTVHRSEAANSLKLKLTLGRPPEKPELENQPAWETLGVKLQTIPPDEFRKNRETRYRGGLTITAVRPNSPAASQGILPGDILVGMHIWETATIDNVAYILKRPDFAKLYPVKFFILRGDETLYGFFPATAAKTAQR